MTTYPLEDSLHRLAKQALHPVGCEHGGSKEDAANGELGGTSRLYHSDNRAAF